MLRTIKFWPPGTIDAVANRLMVALSTTPPRSSQYGDTSVPPPQKLIRNGARALISMRRFPHTNPTMSPPARHPYPSQASNSRDYDPHSCLIDCRSLSRSLKDAPDKGYKFGLLLHPSVREIHFLPPLYNLHGLFRMEEDIFNLSRQILPISKLKENETLVVKVVLDARRARRNDRLPECQILKDACRGVQLTEDAPTIRHDANITFSDCLGDIFRQLGTKVPHSVLQTLTSGRGQHSVEKLASWAIDPKLRGGYRALDPCEGFYRKVQAIPLNRRAVIHDHERLT